MPVIFAAFGNLFKLKRRALWKSEFIMSQQLQQGGVQYHIGGCKEHSCNCQNFQHEINDQNICLNCKHDIGIHIDFEKVQEYNFQNKYIENPRSTIEIHPDNQNYMNQMHQPVREQPPPNTIWFYNRNEEYYEFTNFKEGFEFRASLGEISKSYKEHYEEKTWHTSEHLFQAAKFMEYHPEIVEQIRKCRSPRDALNLARMNQHLVDPNWQEMNVEVMKWVVGKKFKQNRILAERLLSTGDKKLVEHTTIDKFWGDGGDGNGLNWLGRILMEVRDELKTMNFEVQYPQSSSNSPYNVNNIGLGPNGSEGNPKIPPPLPLRVKKRDMSKYQGKTLSNQNKNQQHIQNQDQQYSQAPNQIQYVPVLQLQPQHQLHYQPTVTQNMPSENYVYYAPQYGQQNLNNNPNM
ncbi:364_t:CDS:2 [Cetraspora pellucida]|uniref:364_t:CDS:1 n=1 Tax=Cetraspora pellucida TaxID=1433469 RepID=A0A9N8ZQC0_9GLOM|nr:364_t:CDS:2 [Cetraspora pellucida]